MLRKIELEEKINVVLNRIEELNVFKFMFTSFTSDKDQTVFANFDCSDIEYELSFLQDILNDLNAELILLEN